jgi:hypothetical protein
MLPRTVHGLYDTNEQDECEVIQHDYPDNAQLSGILGTPDKPELHVLHVTHVDEVDLPGRQQKFGKELYV